MLLPLCLGILVTSMWSIVRTCKAIGRKPRRLAWWLAFAVFAAAGAGIAIWSLSHSWQISSNIKFVEIPIPATMLTWDENGWTDSAYPAPVTGAIALIDILACAAFALIPLMLAVRVSRKPRPPELQASP